MITRWDAHHKQVLFTHLLKTAQGKTLILGFRNQYNNICYLLWITKENWESDSAVFVRIKTIVIRNCKAPQRTKGSVKSIQLDWYIQSLLKQHNHFNKQIEIKILGHVPTKTFLASCLLSVVYCRCIGSVCRLVGVVFGPPVFSVIGRLGENWQWWWVWNRHSALCHTAAVFKYVELLLKIIGNK